MDASASLRLPTMLRTLTTLAVLAALPGLTTARPASAAPVTVPFNVGVGPAFQLLTGPVMRDQTVHFGLRLELAAVIDQATIQANKDRIPAKYRKMAAGVSEVRYRPSIFIPETLFISPAFGNTGMYGATWRFISLGMPFGKGPVRLRLGASVILTMAVLHSSTLRGLGGEDTPFVFFLRPGVDLTAELEVKLAKNFLISLGWNSAVHLPQVIRRNAGTSLVSIPGDADSLKASLWHFGQPFVMLHYRFPVTRNIPGALPAKKPQQQQPPRQQAAPPKPQPQQPVFVPPPQPAQPAGTRRPL